MSWSLNDYEEFVYRISDLSPHISFSTLVLKRRGKLAGVLTGEIIFAEGITLAVYENLSFVKTEGAFIHDYGYEVKAGEDIQYWYDSQPHPNDQTLQATHPHHKHIHPDIKHHRIPAPELSFEEPNLPFLIREIENLFLRNVNL